MSKQKITTSAQRIPEAPYVKLFSVTVIMILVLCICAESFFSSQGHLPSITDDKALWAYHRGNVYTEKSQRRIVLLGASRIQLGVDPKILEDRFPGFRVNLLAVDGHGTLDALKDLANDSDFNGIIICSATAANIFKEDLKAWIEYFHRSMKNYGWINTCLNLKIRLALQQRFVIFSFWTNFERQVGYLFQIPISHVTMRTDRYRPAMF